MVKRVYWLWTDNKYYTTDELERKVIKKMNKEQCDSGVVNLRFAGINDEERLRQPHNIDATVDMESYGEGYDLTNEK